MRDNFNLICTNELNHQSKQQVLDLWNNEYPKNLMYNNLDEFDHYLQGLKKLSHFLLIDNTDLILAWAFTFDRNNEKWFAIVLSEEIQGKGFGRKMLNELKKKEPVLNAWVIDHNKYLKKNGKTYGSPLKFYLKCKFEIESTTRLELDKISAVKIKWSSEKQ